jgi:hypothetical protein
MRLASSLSSFDNSPLLSSAQSLIEAAGAKLGIPLTVPWPPHCIHGARSAMSPSRSRKGYGRVALMEGSALMVAERRTSLAMLPPHLFNGKLRLTQYRSVSHVNLTPHRFDVCLMTASIMAEDMSRPAEFAGKLYRKRGI